MLHWVFTFSRFVLAPVSFVALRAGYIKLVIVLIFYATASDFLDGYFARKNNAVTPIGALADAVADKTFINLTSLAFCLYIQPENYFLQYILASWFVRDVVMTMLWVYAKTEFKSLYIGKVYTALQFVFILTMAISAMLSYPLFMFSYIMLFVFIALGIVSAKDYFVLMLM